MEQKGTITTVSRQLAGLSKPSDISEKVKMLMKALVGINQLLPFKMTADDFLDWARSIDRLMPDVDEMAIAFVVDKFMTDEIVYDKTKGIQNIFQGLKKITKEGSTYTVKTTYTW